MATNARTGAQGNIDAHGEADPDDVKTVLELEARIGEVFGDVAAALPALTRLTDANYAGADFLRDVLNGMLYDHHIQGREVDSSVLAAMVSFRVGAGDQAAYDNHDLVVMHGMDVGSAIAELLNRDRDDVDRVDAFIRYTKVQARP